MQSGDTTLSGLTLSGNPDFVGPYVRYDPRRYQTIIVDGISQSGNYFFNPNAFRRLEVLDFSQAREGTLGRNIFDGPGISLWSLSLIKEFHFTDSHRLELRADFRNLFNHAMFSDPLQDVDGALPVGVIVAAGPGRTVQLSLRYSF